ncbi:hypothetical protein B0H15DRAFT_951386 [Mycena belliarum]|uniref:Uncharacterized protein n=1 Tax=Mycena belliarum TaxID=1033014 RepID=A0AAD6TZY1_9AGAR|nr:hypothetical protein B0H15DRAFT_951386 [Mycena belliae]
MLSGCPWKIEQAIIASDETEGDAALCEDELELALDILDSGEIGLAEPAAPANLSGPTVAHTHVTGPHGQSDDLLAIVEPTSGEPFIATPIMKLWRLKFNPKYPAIYCDTCQQYVPLYDISPHLSNGWMFKEYSEPEQVLKSKPHPKVKAPKDLADQILQELAATPELTGVSTETRFPDSSCWKELMVPNPGAIRPVEGLPQYQGIQCATKRQYAPCRPFYAPLHATVRKYSSVEATFIHIVLQETIAPTQSVDGSPLMLFSNNQQAKLACLHTELNLGNLDSEKIRTCLNEALSALYFPPDAKSLEKSWQSPLAAYLYSQGIDRDGNFTSARSMGSFLAKMQFAIRLRGHDNLLDMLDKFQIEEGEGDSNQWTAKVHDFCEAHLSEANYSPFANLRAWLRAFWKARQDRVLASADAANWIDSKTVIISGGTCIGVDAFGKFVRDLIKSTKMDIEEKVLLGIRLLDIGVQFEDLIDDGRMEPGYSPICSGIDFPYNSDSAKFVLALLAGNHMGLRRAGNRLTWEPLLFFKWKQDLDKTWQNLYTISHIVGGPEPLFGSQEMSLRLLTTVRRGQPVEPREVFVADGSVSFITNRVAKKMGAPFQPADVIHLLPPQVSSLFRTLIRVVRPAAVSLTLIEGKILPQNRETFLRDQRDLVFASMTAETMRDAFRTPFQESFGVPMTRPLYKNLALCLATRGVPTRKMGLHSPSRDEDPSSGIADRQAGRSKGISEANYAILQEDHGMSPSLRKHQLTRIHEWHRFLGL